MRVITANLCSWGEGEVSIPNRMPRMTQVLLRYAPDLIGVQESTPQWTEYLAQNLPGYGHISQGRDGQGRDGQGRDGDNTGEACGILYRKDRLTLLKSGTFWLSETPDILSQGWDGACRRICTWGHFRDSQGRGFALYNTHLDHMGPVAQLQGAKLLAKTLGAQDFPCVLTGDLNVTEDSDAYKILAAGLRDVKYAAPQSAPMGTWHNYGEIKDMTGEKPIDHIFVTPGFTATDYRILTDRVEGGYISDHFPVLAELV